MDLPTPSPEALDLADRIARVLYAYEGEGDAGEDKAEFVLRYRAIRARIYAEKYDGAGGYLNACREAAVLTVAQLLDELGPPL